MGLRFWNQVDEDGTSFWVFESRNVRLYLLRVQRDGADSSWTAGPACERSGFKDVLDCHVHRALSSLSLRESKLISVRVVVPRRVDPPPLHRPP